MSLPIESTIEGLLFMAGEEGLSLLQIQSVLTECTREEISKYIQNIKSKYQSKEYGFEIKEYAQRYKFVTKEEVYPYAQKLYSQIKSVSLSQAALETLAIIAYKQPITRMEIEEIRGVGCDLILKKLTARGFIEAKDRLDVIGKPLLYTVTDEFLDSFDLSSLAELPELTEKSNQNELFES